MTSLSVIIPAYIREPAQIPTLLACLCSLQHFASKQVVVQFIIQDDASPGAFLPALIPMCAASTMRNEQNLGFSGNLNTGVARANGDVLVFINQDVTCFPGSQNWDLAIVNAFADTTVGVVGAKLLFPPDANGEMGIQSAGGLFDAHCQPTHRWLGYKNHMLPEYNQPGVISWVTGAALAVRADVFKQVGGLDTGYAGGYFEDVALCCAVREAGFYVAYQPQWCMIHAVGSTGGNPNFAANAQRFKRLWVDTGKVHKDTEVVRERWW